MGESCWNTTDPVDPVFEHAWNGCLAGSPHANFSLDPGHLAWEARHGRPALAALIEEGGRRGALVLRSEGRCWVSGWPWRWQVVVEDPGREGAVGLSEGESRWLFAHARRLAGSRPLRCYLPVPPAGGTAGYFARATLLQSLAHGDEELFETIHKSKRRMIRRARSLGYQVIEATRPEQYRAFWMLQGETEARHGHPRPRNPDLVPAPGEEWREWELPWMWLLIAVKDGTLQCGSGDGLRPGGMLEGRTAASTLAALGDGANALIGYEEARRARDKGYRWCNLGGDTIFKRQLAGRRGVAVPIYCWQSGGALWGLADHLRAWTRRSRSTASSRLRGTAKHAKSGGGA